MNDTQLYKILNDINKLALRDRLIFLFLTSYICSYFYFIDFEATGLKFNSIRKQLESQSQIHPSTAHTNLSCFIIRTI